MCSLPIVERRRFPILQRNRDWGKNGHQVCAFKCALISFVFQGAFLEPRLEVSSAFLAPNIETGLSSCTLKRLLCAIGSHEAPHVNRKNEDRLRSVVVASAAVFCRGGGSSLSEEVGKVNCAQLRSCGFSRFFADIV